MRSPRRNLTASQAAAHLGVSAKALRIYERYRLLAPGRTTAGWRTYTPDDLKRAAEIVSLRALGFGLPEIARVLDGGPSEMNTGLALHESRLKQQAAQIAETLRRIRSRRDEAFRDRAPTSAVPPNRDIPTIVGFELPWPWGGEWFELSEIGTLNFITGPLGSGKTRFAMRLAEALPDAAFLGLDRLSDEKISRRLVEGAGLTEPVEQALAGLAKDGAERSDALLAFVIALESCTTTYLVVDMVEEDLSEAAQRAVISYLRKRHGRRPTLFLMTRSSALLDLDAVGADESLILCPANHSPPIRVSTYPGGHGYEAVATCLAAPNVRARTAGVIAMRSDAA